MRCKDAGSRRLLQRLLDPCGRAEFESEVPEADLAWWRETDAMEMPERIEVLDEWALRLRYDSPVVEPDRFMAMAQRLSRLCGEAWLQSTGDEDGYELAKFVQGKRVRHRTR